MIKTWSNLRKSPMRITIAGAAHFNAVERSFFKNLKLPNNIKLSDDQINEAHKHEIMN